MSARKNPRSSPNATHKASLWPMWPFFVGPFESESQPALGQVLDVEPGKLETISLSAWYLTSTVPFTSNSDPPTDVEFKALDWRYLLKN